MEQKPSIGRIVHILVVGNQHLAAIITAVHADSVDLTVFPAMELPQLLSEIPYGEGPYQWHWPERV